MHVHLHEFGRALEADVLMMVGTGFLIVGLLAAVIYFAFRP